MGLLILTGRHGNDETKMGSDCVECLTPSFRLEMIPRRTFVLVCLFILDYQWHAFAQPEARQMFKTEGQNLRIYDAEDRRRFELLDKHQVVIERIDLKKTFILNLDSKTFTEKPYEPIVEGTIELVLALIL